MREAGLCDSAEIPVRKKGTYLAGHCRTAARTSGTTTSGSLTLSLSHCHTVTLSHSLTLSHTRSAARASMVTRECL